MGPLEAFLRSIPEHDQQRKKGNNSSKGKMRYTSGISSKPLTVNSTLALRPSLVPPLSENVDVASQPSTSGGEFCYIILKKLSLFFGVVIVQKAVI